MRTVKLLFLFTCLTLLISNCKKEKNSSNKSLRAVTSTKAKVNNIDTKAFKKLIDSGNVILLDVRTTQEITQGSISGSSNVNFYDSDFKEKINLIDKSKTICVYCKSGGRSSKAATILAENGFSTIYNLKGGLISWEDAKLPLTKATLSKDEGLKTMSLKEFNELLKTDKPVLVNFHTEWCAPCRKMAPIVDEIEKEFNEKAIVTRINIGKCRDISKAYEIKSIPTFIVFKKGKVIWRNTGIISKEVLSSKLN